MIDTGYLPGRFEFLHYANIAWIVKSRLRFQRLRLVLLPGSSDWFLEDFVVRKEFLTAFHLADEILAYDASFDSEHTIDPPPRDEIPDLIDQFISDPKLLSKVFMSPSAFKKMQSETSVRNTGLVTTNGCYDILHPGHLHTLRSAKSAGSQLVVLINSDVSIRNFKGKDRPIHSQQFRAALLAQLSFVDYVVCFDTDTPLESLALIQPDVHVKGGSFLPERIASEKKMIEQWGGVLLTFPLLGSYSTTSILMKNESGVFPV